jgi:hypothetical protein
VSTHERWKQDPLLQLFSHYLGAASKAQPAEASICLVLKPDKMSHEDRPTIEKLLGHLVAEFQQVSTDPSGSMIGKPFINGDGNPCIQMRPLCSYEAGCPRNFGDFVSNQSVAPAIAFPWYARSRLRYSCSKHLPRRYHGLSYPN